MRTHPSPESPPAAQSFTIELCRLLGLPEPHHAQDYMFERPVSFRHVDGGSSACRIDCYKCGCFVLETKKLKGVGAQGTATAPKRSYDDALLRARRLDDGRLLG